MRSESSRPSASPRPNPASASSPRREALEDHVALGCGHAGPVVADDDAHAIAAPDGHAHTAARRRVAQRVVDEDADDPCQRAGVGDHPARRRRQLHVQARVALAGADRELRRHGTRDLPGVDELAPQLDARVEAAEVEQLGGERAQPARVLAQAVDLADRVAQVGRVGGQVVAQQLEHAVQRGQRRAQLVAGRRHERLARLLLAAQACAHGRQRAAEVADLVARRVGRHRVRAGVGVELDGRAPQPPQAPRQGAGQRDADEQRGGQAGQRGHQDGALHDPHRRGDVVKRLGDHHDDRGPVAPGGDDGGGLALAVDLAHPGDRRPDRARYRDKAGAGLVGVGVVEHGVAAGDHDHAGAGAAAQAAGQARDRAVAGLQLAAVELGERPARGDGGRGQVLDLLAAQPLLERREQRQRGHDQHHRRGGDQRGHELDAEPDAGAPPAISRPGSGSPRRGR